MGILDQLKKEVDSKRTAVPDEADIGVRRETEYQQNLLPKMQKILATLQELLEYLGQLGTIEVKDYSTSMPQIGTLKQSTYKINTDGVGGFAELSNLRQINLIYRLSGHDTFSYTVEGKLAGEQELDNLHARKVKMESRTFINDRGIPCMQFTIERNFTVFVKFDVDYDNSKIKLFFVNHENLANLRQSFTADEITDQFLDEFVRYLIRKDKVFLARMGKRAIF